MKLEAKFILAFIEFFTFHCLEVIWMIIKLPVIMAKLAILSLALLILKLTHFPVVQGLVHFGVWISSPVGVLKVVILLLLLIGGGII